MARFVVARVGQYALVLLIAVTLNFLADRRRTFVPGSRVVFSVPPEHLRVYPK